MKTVICCVTITTNNHYMKGDNTDMKKILFITMLMLSLVANVCFASYNITNSNHDLLKPYWGIIPMNEE